MVTNLSRMCGAVILTMGMAAFGQEAPKPSYECKANGRGFQCSAFNIEGYSVLPKWTLHTKKPYQEFGEGFSVHKAPKDWTLLEMRVYPDDQSGAPYDGIIYIQALSWVRVCGNRAVFAQFIKDVDPPECK